MGKLKVINKRSILEILSFGLIFFLLTIGIDYFSDQPIELGKLAKNAIVTMVVYGLLITIFNFFSEKKTKEGKERWQQLN